MGDNMHPTPGSGADSPGQVPKSPNPGRLECPHCSRKFSRPSHLDRHRRTHLPPSRRLSIPCGKCDKSFGRHDVFLRHLRAAHQVVSRPRQSCQRSCNRCVQKRRKCDRGQPCQLCAVAGEPCSYPSSILQQPLESQDESVEVLGDAEGAGRVESSFGQSEAGERLSLMSFTPPDSIANTKAPSSIAGHTFASDAHCPGFDPFVPCVLDPVAENSQAFLPSPNSYSDFFSEAEYNMASDMHPFVTSLSVAGQLDIRGSGLDWLDFNVPDISLAENAGVQIETEQTRTVHDGYNAPLPTLPSFRSRTDVQPWPFDQTEDFTPHRCSLPPLREVLQSTVQSGSPPLQAILGGLVSLMSEPRLPHFDELMDPNMVHGAGLLKGLVDVYLMRFHPILPLLHVPTWDMSSIPTVLVAAMACIGALVSDDDNGPEIAAAISEICMPIIAWLGSSDTSNYRDISYLDALCLHQIYSLGSGNRRLYQNADRSRGILIGSLRGVGYLTSRLSMGAEAQDPNPVKACNSSSLRDEWLAWVSLERENRIAWSSFEYDCSLCTLTSRRGAVDLSELPSRLPCSETLWDAPSAPAWAALRARAAANNHGAAVSSILKAILSGNPVPTLVSYWGKRLCAQIIGRLLWDLKQLEILSTLEYFGLPTLSLAKLENKSILLLGLDTLLASMDQPASTADLISYNIASLICHYSHLYTSRDALDIILYIVRNVVSRGTRLGEGIQMAERRLQATFSRDPREARRLVHHAAQIVGVANDYLVSAPCEIMRLFMGYIFIIAFAKYCPQSHRCLDHSPTTSLDLASQRVEENDAVANWIEYGGAASIGTVSNIFLEGAALSISRDAQKMLQLLKCWGLAEKFTKILQSFESTVLVTSDA